MPPAVLATLEPRKSPVQARSASTVDAILEATVQVLLQVGKDRLTTTRVAHRAGVSVGTLYQYFPNKTALLRSALSQHLEEVTAAVERTCKAQRGQSLQSMGTALACTFLEHKMNDGKTSVALYSVSSDVDGMKIAQEKASRSTQAIAAMLETAPEPLTTKPEMAASVLLGAMAGISRRLLESPAPEEQFAAVRHESVVLACAYLQSCSSALLG